MQPPSCLQMKKCVSKDVHRLLLIFLDKEFTINKQNQQLDNLKRLTWALAKIIVEKMVYSFGSVLLHEDLENRFCS